jgi:hypothetical protein
MLDELPPRQTLAVRWRFGLRCEPMRFADIADRYGVSTTRAQQIVAGRALPLLARKLRQDYPERYAKLTKAQKVRAVTEERSEATWQALTRPVPLRKHSLQDKIDALRAWTNRPYDGMAGLASYQKLMGYQ